MRKLSDCAVRLQFSEDEVDRVLEAFSSNSLSLNTGVDNGEYEVIAIPYEVQRLGPDEVLLHAHRWQLFSTEHNLQVDIWDAGDPDAEPRNATNTNLPLRHQLRRDPKDEFASGKL
ncbi:MAG: hypothetical protein WDM84_07180 [Bauldia sp.]